MHHQCLEEAQLVQDLSRIFINPHHFIGRIFDELACRYEISSISN